MFRRFVHGIRSPIPTRMFRALLGAVSSLEASNLASVTFAKPPRDSWDRGSVTPEGPHQHPLLCSALCRQRDFDTPWFRDWIGRFATQMRYHRGLWEWVYVSEALRQRGALRSPFRGVGFGVGAEPLSATFASFGCHITATDLPPDEATKKGWAGGVQYAGKIEGLRNDQICPEEQFRRLVDFRYCDMNGITSDLREFDFCWSCCALEHLGSLSAGMGFIEQSLDTLRPGGWAVHTTEFNIFSDVATIERGSTVLYRQRDLKRLVEHLQRRGHQVAPLDLTPGDQVLDRFVDVPPYEQCEPHLALAIRGFASTSVAIIVQKEY